MMDDSFGGGQILLYLTIGALAVLVFMIFVIRVGLKNSKGEDLMETPPPEELLDKAAAGERISILPERPDVVVDVAPSVLNPERPKDDAIGELTSKAPAPDKA